MGGGTRAKRGVLVSVWAGTQPPCTQHCDHPKQCVLLPCPPPVCRLCSAFPCRALRTMVLRAQAAHWPSTQQTRPAGCSWVRVSCPLALRQPSAQCQRGRAQCLWCQQQTCSSSRAAAAYSSQRWCRYLSCRQNVCRLRQLLSCWTWCRWVVVARVPACVPVLGGGAAAPLVHVVPSYHNSTTD